MLIPGAMHPDFFDGETPIMEETGLARRIWKVHIERTYEETMYVAADTEEDAEGVAEGVFDERDYDADSWVTASEVKHLTSKILEEVVNPDELTKNGGGT